MNAPMTVEGGTYKDVLETCIEHYPVEEVLSEIKRLVDEAGVRPGETIAAAPGAVAHEDAAGRFPNCGYQLQDQ